MPDSFGKRQRRESKERKAAARAERKQARRADPEAFRGWDDVQAPEIDRPIARKAGGPGAEPSARDATSASDHPET